MTKLAYYFLLSAAAVAALVLIFGGLRALPVHAEEPPRFLVSWVAKSYTPPWYTGKVFPTRGSEVSVRFSLINNRGRRMDTSNLAVRWYVNRKLVANEEKGLGIDSFSFIVRDFPGRSVEVRMTVLDLGEDGLPIDKIIRIPVVHPYVGISSSLADTTIPAGTSATFTAHPFFFNINDIGALEVEWESEGQRVTPEDDPWSLRFSTDPLVPSGTRFILRVLAQNPQSVREFAGNSINFRAQ